MADSSGFRLDFLGIVALLGGDIALQAWRFCTIEKRYGLFAIHLVPGQLDVAKELFRRSNTKIGRFFAPGAPTEPARLVGLESNVELEYVGLNSGTNAPVQNPLAIALQGIGRELPLVHEYGGKDSRRPVLVRVLRIENGPLNGSKIAPVRTLYPWVFAISTLASFAGTFYVGFRKDWFALTVCILGLLANLLFHAAAKGNGTYHASANPDAGSPPGHSLISGPAYEGQEMILLLGSEVAIQRFLQKPLSHPVEHPYALLNAAAGIMGVTSTLAYFVLIPAASLDCQLAIAGMFAIGLVTNALLASRAGDALLKEIAKADYGVKPLCNRRFRSRTAAVSYAALITNMEDPTTLNRLLPVDALWTHWKKLLVQASKHQVLASSMLSFSHIQECLSPIRADLESSMRAESSFAKKFKLWNTLCEDLEQAVASVIEDRNSIPLEAVNPKVATRKRSERFVQIDFEQKIVA
ncbi:hypothetical protein HDU89_003094 [Geranomyces variabilis]|nr:hypothetical protein HDU89_003094 [Geranomyces variabilis]